jgi:hypothetical protein
VRHSASIARVLHDACAGTAQLRDSVFIATSRVAGGPVGADIHWRLA